MTKHPKPVQSFDVAIVGCGPVGATLANLLGLCGVSTLVLEREAQTYHLPRAVHFDDECMRVFQAIGLSDAILPHVLLSPGMRFVDAEGRVMLDWPRPTELTPMGWNLSYRFHQPDLENILRDGLKRWPHVAVRNRCDVFAIDQHEEGVRIRYENLQTGELLEAGASYVVGCDGARSLVRRFIGAGLEDLGFHERWLVVDVLLRRERPDLGDYSIQHCDPKRPSTYIRGTGFRRRWEIAVHDNEDAHAIAQAPRVWQLLSPWIGDAEADIERAAVYTFHSAIAESWRNGRLMLAGDAAHQTPPFLGQGMCAGIRDAANLGWKLVEVLGGGCGSNLLDTYQTERSPHVREFIELAIRLGGLINTRAMEHGLAAGKSKDNAPFHLEVRKPRLGPGLAVGDVALAGGLAPQFKLWDGRRSDDFVGYRHCLLAGSRLASSFSDADRAMLVDADIIVLNACEAQDLTPWLVEHEIEAALVRPDRYILGVARGNKDLGALLAQLCGPAIERHST